MDKYAYRIRVIRGLADHLMQEMQRLENAEEMFSDFIWAADDIEMLNRMKHKIENRLVNIAWASPENGGEK